MSHFTVLVIGEDPDTLLAPYHEFECTGQDDEYIVDVDRTEEISVEFESETKDMYKDSDGKLHDPYSDEFYREPTKEEEKTVGLGIGCGKGISWTSKDWGDGKGYRAKVHFLPDGFEEVKVPRKEVESFAQYVKDWHGIAEVKFGEQPDLFDKHKYGYCLLDEKGEPTKIVDRTNPNAKWDWYQIGGRYQGHLKLKDGAEGKVGDLSLVGVMQGQEYADSSFVDQARKVDVDFEGMMDEAGEKAGERYDRLENLMEGSITPLKYTWKEVLDSERFKELDIDEKRSIYHGQDALKQVDRKRRAEKTTKEDRDFLLWLDYESYICTREEYIQKARDNAVSTFAVIKDGEWYERGEMGWWANVSDEKDKDEWNTEFSKLLDDVSDDTLLTVVDCHI